MSRIVSFRKDDQGDWIAEVYCGHTRHVRLDPPWTTREWVTTAEGRARFLDAQKSYTGNAGGNCGPPAPAMVTMNQPAVVPYPKDQTRKDPAC
jgi:hypothetical protein